MRVAVIGVGNLGAALVEQIIAAGATPDDLVLVHRNTNQHDELGTRFGCRVYPSLAVAPIAEQLDFLVLAVKPQDAAIACRELRSVVTPQSIVLSVMAGIPTEQLIGMLGHSKIARAMPNLGATVGESATTYFCHEDLSEKECELVRVVLSSFGRSWRVEREDLIDVATAVAGSGPAYFCWLAEQIEVVAVAEGIAPELAHHLIVQTLRGTAAYLDRSATPFAVLRKRVSSRGGTTFAATSFLQANEAEDIFQEAVRAALRRAQELAGA